MAKKEEKKKTVLERTYNVPLRKKYMKAPRWKRTPKAVKALKEFIKKHMKATEVSIGKYANMELWKHGMKNPPHHIKVNAVKNEEGLVKVELVGAPEEEVEEKKEVKKPVKKEEKKEEKIERIEDKLEGKKEEKIEKAREIEKEEIKELKKERPKEHTPKQTIAPKKVEQHPTAPMGR